MTIPGAALVCLLSLRASAASTNVLCGSPTDRYNPTNVTINAGDQVIWNWVGSLHTTTSGTNNVPSGLWNSGTFNAPHSFTNTFNTGGRFSYYCSTHFNLGMTGLVQVIAANSAPTVSISSPLTGTVFVSPASVTLQATAGDSDGSVTNVQFRFGTTLLTNQTTIPYTVTTNNVGSGNFTLTAIAADNLGATATNSVAIIVDARPIVSITSPASNAVFAAPATVTLQATASDNDGSVTNVQLLVGANVLTNQASGPFFGTTNNLASTNYILSAIASDNNGIKNTNSIPITVVTPVAVSLTNGFVLSGTNFQFKFAANVGLSYVIQRSTNLASTNWLSIVTNVAASNPVVFVDTKATNPPAYYRVGRMPNP